MTCCATLAHSNLAIVLLRPQVRDLNHDDIRRLEELSLNAWPALSEVAHDGWRLRFAGGYTGRSNSVQVLDRGTLDVREKIRFCEDEYARRGIPLLFKLTDAARPEGLDGVLEGLGYRAFNHTSVRVAQLSGALSGGEAEGDIQHADCLNEDWVSALLAFRPIPEWQVPTLRAILGAIALPTCFALLMEDEQPVACGLGVLEREWVGLFDIVTRPDARRRGHGTQIVQSIMSWARGRGATHAYLQVMRENQPAIRLYGKAGFFDAYSYWYRGRPRPT
jgi:GNAT superfamily N-acetyltransferase